MPVIEKNILIKFQRKLQFKSYNAKSLTNMTSIYLNICKNSQILNDLNDHTINNIIIKNRLYVNSANYSINEDTLIDDILVILYKHHSIETTSKFLNEVIECRNGATNRVDITNLLSNLFEHEWKSTTSSAIVDQILLKYSFEDYCADTSAESPSGCLSEDLPYTNAKDVEIIDKMIEKITNSHKELFMYTPRIVLLSAMKYAKLPHINKDKVTDDFCQLFGMFFHPDYIVPLLFHRNGLYMLTKFMGNLAIKCDHKEVEFFNNHPEYALSCYFNYLLKLSMEYCNCDETLKQIFMTWINKAHSIEGVSKFDTETIDEYFKPTVKINETFYIRDDYKQQ